MPKRNRASAFLYFVLPLLLWMSFIFFLSTDIGSANHTRPIFNSILRRLIPHIDNYLSPATIERIDWNIRKTAHVSEYGILAILAYRAVAFGKPRFRTRNVVLPLLIGVLYAASDEFHQSFTPSRQACAQDVFYDSFGVLAGMVICLWHRCAKATALIPPLQQRG